MRWFQYGSAIVMIVVGVGMIGGSFFVGPAKPLWGMLAGGVGVLLAGVFCLWLYRVLDPLMKKLPGPQGFGASMRAMSDKMAGASAMLEQMNLADQLRMTGRDAQAQILAVRDTGALFNFDPVLEFDLLVTMGDYPPYPINAHRQLVSKIMVARAQAGVTVPAKVDPKNRHIIYLSWI